MARLPQTVPECHAVIAQLLERLKVLEERVNLDSNNSSKPPSSNGPGKMNRAQRQTSDRKRGAQPGHKGHTRAMLDECDVHRVVDCRPQAVCDCGGQVELADAPQRHQVFEVPPMRAQVDEYRLYSGRCAGCGKPHAGVLPAGVPKGQLGTRALSLVGVLGTRYHLTQRKIRNLLDQLMGLSFSVGAISQAHGKVAVALKAPVAEAAASLCTAQALWMDETHYPREGIGNWVWAAVQPLLAVFAIVCVHGVLIRANQPALASGARPLCRRLRGGQPVGATATGMGRGIRLGGAVLAMKACTALCMNSHRSTPWRRQVS